MLITLTDTRTGQTWQRDTIDQLASLLDQIDPNRHHRHHYKVTTTLPASSDPDYHGDDGPDAAHH